jgi:hypothetical protein
LKLNTTIDTNPKSNKPLSYDITVDTVINKAKTRFGVKENSIKMLVDLDQKEVSEKLGLKNSSVWINPYMGLQTDGQFSNSEISAGILGTYNKKIIGTVN